MRHTLGLRSGRLLDFENPHPDQIDAGDIVLALSTERRFANQSDVPTTVLQHTIFCYRVACHLNYPNALRRAVLLHDAAEAYMRDIPTRLKALLPGLKEIERRVQEAIFLKLGGDPALLHSPALIQLDTLSGRLEARFLFTRPPAWAQTVHEVEKDLFYRFFPQGARAGDLIQEWEQAMKETEPATHPASA